VKRSELHRRRLVAGMGALALTAFADPDVPPAGSLPDAPPFAGSLLVAAPRMNDPRFVQTVILIARHDRTGAMGIAVNRPIGWRPLAEILAAIGQDTAGIAGAIRIFAGGPVQPVAGFIVHSPDYRRAGTTEVSSVVAMTSDPAILVDIGHRRGPAKSLVAFGYAGWGAGQLEGEMDLGAWTICPGDATLIFDEDRADVWQDALGRATGAQPPASRAPK
jgi:putative transcriptional regulator